MKMSYDQPFYVGINNKRFRGVSIDGYLPALEFPLEQEKEEPVIITRALTPKERDELNQLKAAFIYLDKKINELSQKHYKRKRRGRYLD